MIGDALKVIGLLCVVSWLLIFSVVAWIFARPRLTTAAGRWRCRRPRPARQEEARRRHPAYVTAVLTARDQTLQPVIDNYAAELADITARLIPLFPDSAEE